MYHQYKSNIDVAAVEWLLKYFYQYKIVNEEKVVSIAVLLNCFKVFSLN